MAFWRITLGQRLAIGVATGLAGTVTTGHLLASLELFDLFAPVFGVLAAAIALLLARPFRSSITAIIKNREEVPALGGNGLGERTWFVVCFSWSPP